MLRQRQRTSGHAVTNPANYQLLKNGVAVAGGISQVYYGLDIANQLGSQYGLNVPKMNKYEAVLIVDANGRAPACMPLYRRPVPGRRVNTLRDTAGNPLRSTGTAPTAAPFRT